MPRLLALLLLLAGVVWHAPARASGDYGCTARWRLRLTEMTDCDSRAFLGPANDTRVNLALLMMATRGEAWPGHPVQPPAGPNFDWLQFTGLWADPQQLLGQYASGEGSRCLGNDDAAKAFEAALAASRVPDPDRTTLIAARRALKPDCATSAFVPPAVRATEAQPWAVYLAAAAAFYAGRFDEAQARFATLGAAKDPWLAETARYMVARVELNRAQVAAFDEWGAPRFTKVDRAALARAEAGFAAYARAYPHGRYADSARGLLRRVWWLDGDTAKLAAEYARLMTLTPDARGIDDIELAQEIDNKLLAPALGASNEPARPGALAGIAEPLLVAVMDLRLMRAGDGQLSAATLAGQRAMFAREPALFALLGATHAFYVASRPADVLRLLPDDARAAGPLGLSRQWLRGLALEATRDRNARPFWLGLLPRTAPGPQHAAVELAIALHDERAGALDALFAPGWPFTNEALRVRLLAKGAGPALLRRQARAGLTPRERQVALYVLLWKELTRGAPGAFLADLPLVPADAPADSDYGGAQIDTGPIALGLFTRGPERGEPDCPPLRRIAATLAANPRAVGAQLCLADWTRANGYDDTALDVQPPGDELGGAPSLFPGQPYARQLIYQQLIARADVAPADKAHALYRAVRCYSPGGHNSCGGADVSPAQRYAWFRRLHGEFAAYPWARKDQYYW